MYGSQRNNLRGMIFVFFFHSKNSQKWLFLAYIIFSKNPSSLADVAWSLNIVFSALNIVQRPQHRFLAKLWNKNDVFDETKSVWGS